MDKKKFHIIGESMGGNIAGVYTALHPEDVVKTTLMCRQSSSTLSGDRRKSARTLNNNQANANAIQVSTNILPKI